MHTKRTTGFTLIELLVVIAIIAILAAILFPVFAQAKVAAKKARALSQMKQIGTATIMYSGDYDDMVVTKARWGFGPGFGGDPEPAMTWDKLLQPYVKNWQIMMSTEDNRPKYNTPMGQFRRGFHPAGNFVRGVQVPPSFNWATKGPISLTEPPEPSGTVMFVEKRMRIFTTAAGDPPACVSDPWNHECWFWDIDAKSTRRDDLPLSDPRAPWGQVNNAYMGASVYIFSDSSARAIKANGYANDGVLVGTRLPGYEEKAEWWVGATDPFWDQGLSCLDSGWGATDYTCNLPGQ